MKVLHKGILWVVGAVILASGSLWAQAASGAATFKSKCIVCHGTDGTGNTPLGKQLQAANLHSKEVQQRSDAELHKIVHDGQANMPPFGDQLSDSEIDQVIKYIRQFGKTPAKKKP